MDRRDLRGRYVNPYAGFGLKMFGTEMNKGLFINSLLHGREVVKDLAYLNSGHLGVGEANRKAAFFLL